MKIAYLLLVHSNPILLQRTIDALSCDGCGFFVHVDRKADIRPFTSAARDSVFMAEERIPVYWGEFSQVDATLLLIRQALAAPETYERFVFLQGSTYPIRSGRYIASFLRENRDAEFINAARMPAPGYPLSKLETLRYPSHKPLRRVVSRGLARLGFGRRDHRRHLGDFAPYAGHASWALTRQACAHLAGFTLSNPRIVEFFRNSFAPDESYLQSVFGNSPFRSRARKQFVYADWSTSKGDHPLSIHDSHLASFEASEQLWIEDEWGAGEMLFARKFSDQRLDLVDRVDRMIRRKESAAPRLACTAS
ncbi:MAG TPA: beta-1,6-N-acetylglucosaminyltransferase [Chthoniobacterales bacterium]